MPEQPTSPELGSQTPDEEVTSPQYATTEQLNEIREKLSSDMKSLFGRVPSMVSEAVRSVQPTSVVSTELAADEEENPKKKVEDLLKDEREALNKKQKQIEMQQIRSNLEQNLLDSGAEPNQIKIVVDSLMMRNSSKLAVSTSDLGESSVVFKDNEYEQGVPVSKFVKEYLKTKEGSFFLKKKDGPSLKAPGGKAPPSGDLIYVTRKEAATMDPKILQSGNVRYKD